MWLEWMMVTVRLNSLHVPKEDRSSPLDWKHASLVLFVFYTFISCTENLNSHGDQSDTGGEQ